MQSIELIFCEFLYLLSIKTLFENYFSFLQGVILNTLLFSIDQIHGKSRQTDG